MVYKMSEREIAMRKMANDKAARLNRMPRPMLAVPLPTAAVKRKPAAKKAAVAKSSRKRG